MVAFAPKVIKCDAYGACEQIYLKVFGADHEETLDAAMRALTVGEEDEDEEGEEEDSDRGNVRGEERPRKRPPSAHEILRHQGPGVLKIGVVHKEERDLKTG